MSLIIFTDEESDSVYKCLDVIKKEGRKNDADMVEANINALVELVRAISYYPSIIASSQLARSNRSLDTLIQHLSTHEGLDKLMYTPIKAVLGKGFLLAKITFFNMLQIIARDIPQLTECIPALIENTEKVIFMVMSEEVFIGIVEDKDISDTIRNRAGFLLVNLWEYRLRDGINDFAPVLMSTWESRKKLIPIFGTMMGTVELTQITEKIEPIWLEFIRESDSDEIFESIEEFLFTLTYEELTKLRIEMERMGLSSVTREKAESLIGKKFYDDFDGADSREMYRFFRMRKFNARLRKRSNRQGPHKTLEEYIMCHLLSSHTWIPM